LRKFKALRACGWGAALVIFSFVLPAAARPHRSDAWARSQFDNAEHLHQALETHPAQQLTRPDYQRVINAYRRIYFEAPNSSKADPSVLAVAQLLEEMGRRFEDRTVLQSAIQQYEFLRRQYPGSKARFSALFRIGEIYKEDLHDKEHADEVFNEFLRRYPRNQFAEQARKELAEMDEKVAAAVGTKNPPASPDKAVKTSDEQASGSEGTERAGRNASPASHAKPQTVRVTAIRHWSTSDATHIAIDLEEEVKYRSGRLDHPDRIFFDFLDTKLDPSLGIKGFDLDGGSIQKVRISQFKPHQTRVVLELAAPSDYHASLMSNPPRLLIDVGNELQAKIASAKTVASAGVDAVTKQGSSASGSKTAQASHREPGTPTTDEYDSPSSAVKQAIESLPIADQENDRVTTFITSDGVKKTIVEADDAIETNKTSATKADAPEPKPALQPASDNATLKPASNKNSHKPSATADGREAQPTAAGDRSLIRALGLKIGKIVIDPGHGGHDTGTIGPHGLEEKDLVLDVSKRLGTILASRLGAEVIYTRSDDTFIPLETRTAIANEEAADLFISVHANSSRDPDARGIETYYLNFTSSPDALEVAARENAVSEESIHELQDLVKKIALKEKIEESHEFAVDVERSLHSGLATRNSAVRDRGVKKAPFIVLIGANMPSILAEISFLSNPADERRLNTNDYRQRIAESLYRGIAHYVHGLSGVKVASKIEKAGTE
jgi:N-acetylmuramoyl-L-alanine amidase